MGSSGSRLDGPASKSRVLPPSVCGGGVKSRRSEGKREPDKEGGGHESTMRQMRRNILPAKPSDPLDPEEPRETTRVATAAVYPVSVVSHGANGSEVPHADRPSAGPAISPNGRGGPQGDSCCGEGEGSLSQWAHPAMDRHAPTGPCRSSTGASSSVPTVEAGRSPMI